MDARSDQPLISVCIPAYNRPGPLSALLESIVAQQGDEFEIVVADDCSPCPNEIETAVRIVAEQHPRIPVVFQRNPKTFGYDANLRNLLHQARGDYCFFMADDDLMMPGAIIRVQRAIRQFDNLGVILRSWLSTDGATGRVINTHRYFDSDRIFEPGVDTVVTFFRRSVFISGYVVHRRAALAYSTDRFDGTLLYQLYLSANILMEMNGYYITDYLTTWTSGGTSFFGTAEPERARFAPGPYRPEHMVNFVKGMLEIARDVEQTRGVPVYRAIRRDVDNYAYGYLAKQTESRKVFLKYVLDLCRLGLGRSPFFWLTALLLLVGRKRSVQRLSAAAKSVLGHTPMLGRCYSGRRVDITVL